MIEQYLVLNDRKNIYYLAEERKGSGVTGDAALESIPPLRHFRGVLFGLSTSEINLFGLSTSEMNLFGLSTSEMNLFRHSISKIHLFWLSTSKICCGSVVSLDI